MKKLIAMLLCLTLMAGLFVCTAAADESTWVRPQNVYKMETPAEKVTVACESTSVNVAPFAPSSPGSVGKAMLYAKLFWTNNYGATEDEMVPWLAKGFTKLDSLTYNIEIFDYVKDSKGNPITVDDVIWSLNKSVEIGQFVDGGSNIASLEKIDDYNMTMKLTTDAPNTFSMLVTNSMWCIVDQQWWENASDEEKQNDPATTSSYTVKEFIPGSGATLVANDDYWQTDESYNALVQPAFRNVKEVVYTAITEASMRVIALENNEVDIAGVNASDVGIFYDLENNTPREEWSVLVPPMSYVNLLFPNMDAENVVGSNLELRKAIFYAIEPQQVLVANGYNSLAAAPVTCSASNVMKGYQEEWDSWDYYTYNTDKAKACLEAAGYKPGELTLRLLTSSSLFNDSVRAVIISQLNAIGINVENVAVEQALFSTYKNDPTIWDLMVDVKASTTGHIASYYDYNFSAANYQNGGVNFCKDEELYSRVAAVMADPSDENIQAVEQYLYDNAIIYGMFVSCRLNVGKGTIIIGEQNGKTVEGGCVFTEGYKPAG